MVILPSTAVETEVQRGTWELTQAPCSLLFSGRAGTHTTASISASTLAGGGQGLAL